MRPAALLVVARLIFVYGDLTSFLALHCVVFLIPLNSSQFNSNKAAVGKLLTDHVCNVNVTAPKARDA